VRYQLTIEPNTHFYSEPPNLPGEEVLAAIQERGEALLAEAGLQQYEVSAYARSGHRCAHNLNYWRFGDYLGIGAGAHGKLSIPAEGRIVRTRRTRVPRDYLASVPSAARHVETVPAPELPMEFLMNALRLRDGVPAEELVQLTGCDSKLLSERFAELRAAGLLDEDSAWLRATTLGYRHLDTVLARLA
jgi:oxygen-independent coproporphyrinogen-3 oxidase